MRQRLLRVLVLVCALIPVTGSTLDLLCRIMRDTGPAHAAMVHPQAAESHAQHAMSGHHAADHAAMDHSTVAHHAPLGHVSPDPVEPAAPPCCATLGLPPIAPIAAAPILPVSRQTETAMFWARSFGMTGHVVPPAAPPPRA